MESASAIVSYASSMARQPNTVFLDSASTQQRAQSQGDPLAPAVVYQGKGSKCLPYLEEISRGVPALIGSSRAAVPLLCQSNSAGVRAVLGVGRVGGRTLLGRGWAGLLACQPREGGGDRMSIARGIQASIPGPCSPDLGWAASSIQLVQIQGILCGDWNLAAGRFPRTSELRWIQCRPAGPASPVRFRIALTILTLAKGQRGCRHLKLFPKRCAVHFCVVPMVPSQYSVSMFRKLFTFLTAPICTSKSARFLTTQFK